MLIGRSNARHTSNLMVEKQKRNQDVKYVSEAYLIDKELPKMYDAVSDLLERKRRRQQVSTIMLTTI